MTVSFIEPTGLEIHTCEWCNKDRECVLFRIDIHGKTSHPPPHDDWLCGLCLIQLRQRFEMNLPWLLSINQLEETLKTDHETQSEGLITDLATAKFEIPLLLVRCHCCFTVFGPKASASSSQRLDAPISNAPSSRTTHRRSGSVSRLRSRHDRREIRNRNQGRQGS